MAEENEELLAALPRSKVVGLGRHEREALRTPIGATELRSSRLGRKSDLVNPIATTIGIISNMTSVVTTTLGTTTRTTNSTILLTSELCSATPRMDAFTQPL